jgi:hypothetical protein
VAATDSFKSGVSAGLSSGCVTNKCGWRCGAFRREPPTEVVFQVETNGGWIYVISFEFN